MGSTLDSHPIWVKARGEGVSTFSAKLQKTNKNYVKTLFIATTTL
jgi:Golgi nucleoside diphosphatase